MAVNTWDPTTGHPIFADSDAPDIKLDPTKAAEYAGRGGTRGISGTADRLDPPDGWPQLREGMAWYDTDTGHVYFHNGSGWVDMGDPLGHPYAVAQGSFVTASSIAVNANLTTTIAFPAGRFSVAPFVFVVCQNGRVTGGSEDRTTTGCKVSLSNWSDASMGAGQVVMWQAVQMAPGSAAG